MLKSPFNWKANFKHCFTSELNWNFHQISHKPTGQQASGVKEVNVLNKLKSITNYFQCSFEIVWGSSWDKRIVTFWWKINHVALFRFLETQTSTVIEKVIIITPYSFKLSTKCITVSEKSDYVDWCLYFSCRRWPFDIRLFFPKMATFLVICFKLRFDIGPIKDHCFLSAKKQPD